MSRNLNDHASPWRFVKMAANIRSAKLSYFAVLMVLADHANPDGVCWPSYTTFMSRLGISRKKTVADALTYWRDAGVLTWVKGWGNSHGKMPNKYQLDGDAMQRIIDTQKSESDESSLFVDESSLFVDESFFWREESSHVGTLRSQVLKVSFIKGPIYQRNLPPLSLL